MTWLVEHFADGRARHLQHIETEAHRAAPERPCCWQPTPAAAALVVAEAPPSIERTDWFAAPGGCLDCGAGWAAYGPQGTPLDRLECARCGSRRSAIAEDNWCSGCGATFTALREPGCPTEGTQCPQCSEMKAMVA